MSTIKKAISVMVIQAIIITLGFTTLTSAATLPDVPGSGFEEAATTLAALGIMVGDDTGNFHPGALIKRSEFAKVSVNALGLEQVALANMYPTKFADVSPSHWAIGFINVAANQGLVIGDDNGNFRPDDTISYAEAMTVLVRALGYEPSAQSKGGFPTGYLVVGTENGLGKNVTASLNQGVKRGEVAQMTFNSLTVNLMEQTGFGNNIEFTVGTKTLLTDKLSTTKILGKVMRTPFTSLLEGGDGFSSDHVMIDDQIYKTGGQNVTDLIGFRVVAYAREETLSSESELILIYEDPGRNTSVTVNRENIDILNKTNFNYWLNKETDRDTTKLTFSADVKLIYNGKIANIDTDLVIPESGRVTVLDSNRTGVYDLIFIKDYRNIVVEYTSPSSYTISDKYGNPSIVLDPENKDVKFTLNDIDGEAFEFSELKEWDVVSVAVSKDTRVIDAVVVREMIEGRVNQKDDERTWIDDTPYYVASNLPDELRIGDSGAFYLDLNGHIAAIDKSRSVSKNYAYLMNAAPRSGISTQYDFQLFDTNSVEKIFTATDKIRFNNLSGVSGADVVTALKAGTPDVIPQLVTYEVNSSGMLYEINTAVNESGGFIEHHRDTFVLNYQGNDAIYREASRRMECTTPDYKTTNVNVNERTLVFDIPAGKTLAADFAVRDGRMFSNDVQYTISMYDVTEDLTAGVIIVTNSTGRTAADSPVAVVRSISRTHNSEGQEVERLYAVQGGKNVDFFTSATGILVKDNNVSLQPGDIIQFRTNARDEIDDVYVLFDITEKAVERGPSEAVEGLLYTVYGKVERKFATSFNLTVDDGSIQNYSIGNARITLVDTSKPTTQVTPADSGEIQKHDPTEQHPRRVFISIYRDVIQDIVVIR